MQLTGRHLKSLIMWYSLDGRDLVAAGFAAPCRLETSRLCLADAWVICPQVACELELWQEAFRSVEDIQGLFVLGKKPGKPQMMAVYYARLTKIFTVSESHLYNGCALHSPPPGPSHCPHSWTTLSCTYGWRGCAPGSCLMIPPRTTCIAAACAEPCKCRRLEVVAH